MTTKTLEIHSENIMPIIKKWLYSEKDIFLRELVSNSCDAIQKIKILDDKASDFRIDITIDKKKKTLSISDNGIGMTEEEIEKYISQIAFSGAEDFLEKYKGSNEKDQFIGHFGLGFYSAYMVAEKVEIETLSYIENAKPVFWSCEGTSQYLIDKGSRKKRGTTVTLYIDKDNFEYLEEDRIKGILQKFCPFLSSPIYLNDKHINNKDPLWLKAPSDCTEKEYLEFYRELYPFDQDPIFWIHLNVDYPFNLKGILYFPKIQKNFDINKSSIKLFCNRVFVSDNCKDLLPDYLMILKGAIDSPDIPLNVSRSYLQMDRTVKQLGVHISKKISDKLNSLYNMEKEKFLSFWPDIEMIIKLGILQDEKFYEKSKNFLVFKNLKESWTTVEEYLERNKTKTDNKVFYTQEEKYASNFIEIYKEKDIEVLITNPYIDTAILNHLEPKLSTKFQRIDGNIDDAILDKSKENTLLNQDGKTAASVLADFFRKSLKSKEIEVEAKSLASDKLPAFIMIKEEERRFRDYMNLTQGQILPNMSKHTLVINTNNKLIAKAQKLKEKHPELAEKLAEQIYDLALLSQKELSPSDFSDFVARSTNILESMSELI